uniref:Auxin efflux carrier component n=1 Tax=Zooxanthella nutricula TaxID=1333877 RepID=A0A7S2LTN9_9DINO
MSDAVIKLLLPCLLFTRILPTMSMDMLPRFAWLAIANLTYVTLGSFIGWAAVLLTGASKDSRRILALLPAIGHANSIPFMLIPFLIAQAPGFNEQDAHIAVGYVGLYLVMHSITLWGVGIAVIGKQREGDEVADAPGAGDRGGADIDSDPGAVPRWRCGARSGAVDTMESSAPMAPAPQSVGRPAASGEGVGADANSAAVSDFGALAAEEGVAHPNQAVVATMLLKALSPAGEATWAGCANRARYSWRQWVPQWLNRPMAAASISAVLGLIPSVQEAFASPHGGLNFLFGALDKLGQAGPAVALLSVGALFASAGTPRPSAAGGAGAVAMMVLGRLVILPACAIPLWVAVRYSVPFFPQDRLLMVVICIECCTPTAYNLVTICTALGRRDNELVVGIFYQNVAAIFTMTAWAAIIFSYVV